MSKKSSKSPSSPSRRSRTRTRKQRSPKKVEYSLLTNPFRTKSPLKWGFKINFDGKEDIFQDSVFRQHGNIGAILSTISNHLIRRKIISDIISFEEALSTGDDGSRLIRGVSTVFGFFDKRTGRTYFLFGDVHNNKQQCGSLTRAYSGYPHLKDVVDKMILDKESRAYTDVFAEIYFKYNSESNSAVKYHWQLQPQSYLYNVSYAHIMDGVFFYSIFENFFRYGILPMGGIPSYLLILKSLFDNVIYPYQPQSNIYQIEKMFSGCFEKNKSKCPEKYSKVARFHYTDLRFSDIDFNTFNPEETKFTIQRKPVSYIDYYHDFGTLTKGAITDLIKYAAKIGNHTIDRAIQVYTVQEWTNAILDAINPDAFLYNLFFEKCLMIIVLLFSSNPFDEFMEDLIHKSNFNKTTINGILKTKKELASIDPKISVKIRKSIGKGLVESLGSKIKYRIYDLLLSKLNKNNDPIVQTLNDEWFKYVISTSDSNKTIYESTLSKYYNYSGFKRNFIYRLNVFSLLILLHTGVAMMDLYTLARMFKPSILKKDSNRVMVFAGAYHVFNYAKFLEEEMKCTLFSKSQTFVPYASKSAIDLTTNALVSSTVYPSSSCVNIPPIHASLTTNLSVCR